MKLGMFGLVFFIGVGVVLGYVGHDTLKPAVNGAVNMAEARK